MPNTPPAGVTTRVVTFGKFQNPDFSPATGSITITPSKTFVWAATGDIVLAEPIEVLLDLTGSCSIALAVTDQHGWRDPEGNLDVNGNPVEYLNWTYRAVFNLKTKSAKPSPANFIVPYGDGSNLDLDLRVNVTSTTGVLIGVPSGTAGPQGPQGIPGPVGPAGPAGTNGTNGTNGIQGVAGTAGAAGTQGIQGPTGPAGPAGAVGATGAPGSFDTASQYTLANVAPGYTHTVTYTTGTGGARPTSRTDVIVRWRGPNYPTNALAGVDEYQLK